MGFSKHELLLVREYLRDHTFQQLEDDHGVCARPNATSDKWSLNYDQILIKNGDPVAEQCRGLIVRPLGFKALARVGHDWKNLIVGYVEVVAWPMDRFYNHGDPNAAVIDWSDPNLRVYEKLDGTMIVLYYDHLHGRWHAATRSVPEADLPLNDQIGLEPGTTFSDLFWKAFEATVARNYWGSSPPPVAELLHGFMDKNKTYVFELTGPYNRVVVRYDEPSVTLLAVRDPVTGEELDINKLDLPFIPLPQTWPLNDVTALLTFVDQADPAQLEGAVVCSPQGRLKVKNKAWVLSSRAKDLVTTSRRGGLEAIIQERLDDIIPLLEKDIGDKLLQLQAAYLQLCKQIDDSFTGWRDQAAGNRKEFALLVVGSGQWTPPYFNLFEGRAKTAREWIRGISDKGKLSSSSLDAILTKLVLLPPPTSP